MVGILLNSCSSREHSNDLHLSLRFVLRGTTTRVRMSYGVAESELLTEDTVPRRVQGAMSDKFRTGLDVNKEVNGARENEIWLRTPITGVAYLQSRFPTRKWLRNRQDPGDTLSG
jgi:hypothetical protein